MSNQSTLLPPVDASSALTPNTRSEAEAALFSNSVAQTDSAAPDPASLPFRGAEAVRSAGTHKTEAQEAYRRQGIIHASSTNYEDALRRAQQSSVSSDLSTGTDISENPQITGSGIVTSPPPALASFPPPGQGVVPLNYGQVGVGIGDSIKKSRSRGLSLGSLARQQSWSEQDFKRLQATNLMHKPQDGGYGSSSEK